MAPGGDTGQSLLRLSGRPDVMFGDDPAIRPCLTARCWGWFGRVWDSITDQVDRGRVVYVCGTAEGSPAYARHIS